MNAAVYSVFCVLSSEVRFVVVACSTKVNVHKWKYNGVVLLILLVSDLTT